MALLRRLCVDERQWIDPAEFQDGIAGTGLLPGPASTQLAIFCAWRLRGWIGAVLGGVCFILPGLALIIALAVLFLAHDAPIWVQGAAAGAGAAVAAVAVSAARQLIPASWRRASKDPSGRWRWILYAGAGAAAAIAIGPFLVLVLLACGVAELLITQPWRPSGRLPSLVTAPLLTAAASAAGLSALAWVAFKVGALSYGGGFVIVPLMQADAVTRYHWMTSAQFLNAVALGQITPGPVVQTVAVVGYAAGGIGGALLAAAIAFAPSFAFVMLGATHFHRLRTNSRAQAFLSGAGPAAIGAIAGAAIPLAIALDHLWQLGILLAAFGWMVILRRSVVTGLVAAGIIGTLVAIGGVRVSP